MKIIQITGAPLAGGAEVFICDLAVELALQGHEVMVVFISRSSDFGLDDEYEKHLLGKLEQSGVRYEFLNMRLRKNVITGARRLRRVLDFYEPDVVHAHLYYALFYLFGVKIPVVYTHHNIKLGIPPFVYRLFLNGIVDHYVGICMSCSELIAGVSGRQVSKIYNGVNSQRLKIKVDTRRNDQCLKVLAVGRVQEQKDYINFLDAVKELENSSGFKFSVSIVGALHGDYADNVRRYAESLEFVTKVEFLGCRTDVPELMFDADLLVMSSAWEGFPIVQIEAALTGLPMVVTDVGGCKEVVDQCRSGIAVPPKDHLKLAKAVGEVLSNYGLRQNYSINSRNLAKRFEIAKSAEAHLKVYHSLE